MRAADIRYPRVVLRDETGSPGSGHNGRSRDRDAELGPTATEVAPLGRGPAPLQVATDTLVAVPRSGHLDIDPHDGYVLVLLELPASTSAGGTKGAGAVLAVGPGDAATRVRIAAYRVRVLVFLADVLCGNDARPAGLPVPGDPRWMALIHSLAPATSPITLTADEHSRWVAYLTELDVELRTQRPGYPDAVRALVSLVLTELTRVALGDRHDPRGVLNPLVHDIADAIDALYREGMTVERVARRVGRSPRQLRRLVHDVTGNTVMHWVEQRRMAEARRLLLETDATIEAIGREAGYADPGYFRRQFRRTHAITPQAWRRANR
jgi:AraC family transcriptional activator of pobA